MKHEPQAIEPLVLAIFALGEQGQMAAVDALEHHIGNFSKTHYNTSNSAITAYHALGDMALKNRDYIKAATHYQRVYTQMSYFAAEKEKAFIAFKIARAYKLARDDDRGQQHLNYALNHASGDEALKTSLQRAYDE